MTFTETILKGSYVIEPIPWGDNRGWFTRTYCKREFAQIGHNSEWVQMNHSFSSKQGTIRGMHYQKHPHSEIKMVRCIAGAVIDVIVDLRNDSETFLMNFSVELSAENKKMIYIPAGFAHGFQTLTNNAELIYHHAAYYTPEAEAGLWYDDKVLNIHWPLPLTEISERDTSHPLIDQTFKGL